MDPINIELSEVVDEVGQLLLIRDWKTKGEDVIEGEISKLMEQFNANDVNHLYELIEFEFVKSREHSSKIQPIDELIDLESLSLQKKSNLNKQFQIQSRINNLIEIDESISNLKSNIEIETRYSKVITKNILMSTFITDLISSITTIDLSSFDEIIDILLDCGDYSMYV